jgi:hypothetical protein
MSLRESLTLLAVRNNPGATTETLAEILKVGMAPTFQALTRLGALGKVNWNPCPNTGALVWKTI